MKAFLARLIPKNIAGTLGIVGTIIPAVREIVMAILRVIAIFKPSLQDRIVTIGKFFDGLVAGFNKLKNFFLKVGE